jgi:hypothetical protein
MKKTLTESRFQFLAGVINEKQYLAEAMTGDQFAKFEDDIAKGSPIKAKIEINNQEGIITLTGLKKEESLNYTGVLADNGGIQDIQVLKGQNVKLTNFPTTSENGGIGNTTGEEELKTTVGMKDSIIFTLIDLV